MEFKINEQKDFLYHGENELVADAYIVFTNNDITKVFVDPIYRGQGVAGKMMLKLVDFAKQENIKLSLTCPYAVNWFEKNEQYKDMLK